MLILIRILLLLGLVALVLWWLRAGRMKSRTAPSGAAAAKAPHAASSGEPETMQICTYCGVHVPRSDVVQGAQGVYCCEAHRVAAGAQHP